MTALREYQSGVVAGIDAAIAAGKRRPLLVAPTGSGKTVIAAEVIGSYVAAGNRVLILVHRRELVAQMSAKLYAAGIDHGIIQAGHPARPNAEVQVASVQTLHARAVRSSRMEIPTAHLIVVDEAHHVRARSYRQIIEQYPDAILLGMTATPCRSDGRGLGNVFDCIVECPPVADLIAGGFLVPTKVYAPTRPDLKGVKVARGDYVESQLSERMDQPTLTGDIVTHWHKLADRRRTVVFATSVAHSVNLRDEFRASGVWAEHIDGSTPVEERDAILAKLKAGTVELVCNCMVLTEGWDQPEVSCLVLARPTKSMGLYRQMVGRVLRPAEGKTDALILDHAGAIFEHGFVEEPVVWTLDEDRRAENPTQAARSSHQTPRLTTCPECKAVRGVGQPCNICGWRPQPRAQGIEIADGDLSRVDRNRRNLPTEYTKEGKEEFFRQLAYIAREKGYQSGWASHKYREKFGSWPANRFAQPMVPEQAVRSWVRSRQIAYAKGMARRGAA
jgi:superfamily II DNA or RNA helicase